MSAPRKAFPTDRIRFSDACDLVGSALRDGVRGAMIDELANSSTPPRPLQRLRAMMTSHVLRSSGSTIDLSRLVASYDRRTRGEGLHALHDWDGMADRFNQHTIPVDVLDFLARVHEPGNTGRTALAILLDYYLVYLLALLTLRIWDHGDADENLARVDHLLAGLQGPEGSGHRFAEDAATLMLVATAHYEPDEPAYDRLLARVRSLGGGARTAVASVHARAMGSHLRFGFEATYARDTVAMRKDNVVDYPWLCFAVTTLMAEYERLRETGAPDAATEPVVEALLNGVSPDARAFVGDAPAALAAQEREREIFREAFRSRRDELLPAFERCRPVEGRYSPFSLYFNFSHNVVKGIVVKALLSDEPAQLTLNDLLTGIPRTEDPAGQRKERLALALVKYARSSPGRIRGRLTPAIVYDPPAGRQAVSIALRKLAQ